MQRLWRYALPPRDGDPEGGVAYIPGGPSLELRLTSSRSKLSMRDMLTSANGQRAAGVAPTDIFKLLEMDHDGKILDKT